MPESKPERAKRNRRRIRLNLKSRIQKKAGFKAGPADLQEIAVEGPRKILLERKQNA